MIFSRTFYACFSADPGEAGGFILFQWNSGLFDNPRISKCLNTLFLLSPHFYFITGFICDWSFVRNDSRMS